MAKKTKIRDTPLLQKLEALADGIAHVDVREDGQWKVIQKIYAAACRQTGDKPVPLVREKCVVKRNRSGGYVLIIVDADGERTTYVFS